MLKRALDSVGSATYLFAALFIVLWVAMAVAYAREWGGLETTLVMLATVAASPALAASIAAALGWRLSRSRRWSWGAGVTVLVLGFAALTWWLIAGLIAVIAS